MASADPDRELLTELAGFVNRAVLQPYLAAVYPIAGVAELKIA
jgi:hypothetical protein